LSGEKGLGLKSWISGPRRKDRNVASVLGSHRVAVLPFASMSPNPEDEYFADGMTEEVIATLSRVPELEVISRTSIMQYKKNPRSLKEVSQELGVGTVLEGSVRKAGNHLRITVQMIDASRDRHAWSESYDRELRDVFGIQSEVASKVAEALKVKPQETSLRKKPTTNTEAYTLYLKGRYHWNKRGVDDIKTALDYFELAVKEDPGFALGYAGLADCHQLLATNWQIDTETNHKKAEATVAKALSLDPGLAEAHATKGLFLTAEFKLNEAAEELRRAISLNPNYAPAHLWYYQILLNKGRLDEAREQIEKAVELDPLSTNMNVNHGQLLRRDRRLSRGNDTHQESSPAGSKLRARPLLPRDNVRIAETVHRG
jgi:TolB-like protein